ncbi:hypothetical protein R3P38DRAFT_3214355 [Favolaschia claudopus]|uniref:Uncharacterized protein n=1 Tax=Favolaschia claudopus TaxID=2862362 RepID=A0AAW0AB11_9AGAR
MEIEEEIHMPGSEPLDDLLADGGTHPMINLSGGTGGAGGNGGLNGGVGGNGEGARLYVSEAKRWTVNLNAAGGQQALVKDNYRKIGWGDVYLQNSLYVNTDPWWQPQCTIHKVWSAKINNQDFTAVTYEGIGAEQEWKEDVERYMKMRHGNILQIYGIVQDKNHDIYAAIFHGDYIPFKQLQTPYQNSRMWTVLINAYYCHDYYKADEYVTTTFSSSGYIFGYTLLVQCATGRLCLVLRKNTRGPDISGNRYRHLAVPPTNFLSSANTNLMMQSLALEEYHRLCADSLALDHQDYAICPIHMGSVYYVGSDPVEIASLPLLSPFPELEWDAHWHAYDPGNQEMHKYLTPEGWTRLPSSEVLSYAAFSFVVWNRGVNPVNPWFSQANYIYSQLGIDSDSHEREKYVLFHRAEFWIQLLYYEEAASSGYLFLCPPEDFQVGPASFKWPECCAYWSLDPSGMEQLSDEEASALGFPTICWTTKMRGRSWDHNIYAGLRELHQTKGFDPDSQDVARHLGHPLYQLCSDTKNPDAQGGWTARENALGEEGTATAQKKMRGARDLRGVFVGSGEDTQGALPRESVGVKMIRAANSADKKSAPVARVQGGHGHRINETRIMEEHGVQADEPSQSAYIRSTTVSPLRSQISAIRAFDLMPRMNTVTALRVE